MVEESTVEPQRLTLIKAFSARIDRSGPQGCHIWTGTRNGSGYGSFSWRGEQWLAHRFAYEAWVGPIPPGLEVAHRCHEPACVNPAHLLAQTHAENMAARRGVTKLGPTERDVVRLLWRHTPAGAPQLADLFAVSKTTIYRIVNYEDCYAQDRDRECSADQTWLWILAQVQSAADREERLRALERENERLRAQIRRLGEK